MREQRMHVIPDPREVTAVTLFLRPPRKDDIRRDDVYLCGECGVVLTRGISLEALHDAVIWCPNCGMCNEPS